MSLIASAASLADVTWDHMGGWGVVDWLFMAAFWALIIVGLFWLIREASGSRKETPPSPSEVLERRLAGGEIGVDEYRQRLDALKGAPHPGS